MDEEQTAEERVGCDWISDEIQIQIKILTNTNTNKNIDKYKYKYEQETNKFNASGQGADCRGKG